MQQPGASSTCKVKYGEGKKHKLRKKPKFCENRGICINLAGIGGIYKFCRNKGSMQYASMA